MAFPSNLAPSIVLASAGTGDLVTPTCLPFEISTSQPLSTGIPGAEYISQSFFDLYTDTWVPAESTRRVILYSRLPDVDSAFSNHVLAYTG